MKNFSISDSWYHLTQDRCLWKQLIAEGLKNLLDPSKFQCKPFFCETCQRSFRRVKDKKKTQVYNNLSSTQPKLKVRDSSIPEHHPEDGLLPSQVCVYIQIKAEMDIISVSG